MEIVSLPPHPPFDKKVVILSGAGLSVASGVPTFRGAGGLWEGYRLEEVATPEAWFADRELVRRFYDMRREGCAAVQPNPGHDALAELQNQWGVERVVLVTQNIDGLLQKAGAQSVIEMHGSLWRLKCERDDAHPSVAIEGEQSRDKHCAECGGFLRPEVVWFGEVPAFMGDIGIALSQCGLFLSVGTSGQVYPAAGFSSVARHQVGAITVEVNPAPTGGSFGHVVADAAETALPRIVEHWLSGTTP